MAITNKQNQILQSEYDKLRAQGMSKDQATQDIKASLQLKNTQGGLATGNEQSAFDALKNQYQASTPTPTPTPTTSQSAQEYNLNAQKQGRQDWQTAYRTDVLKLPQTEHGIQVQTQQAQPAQQPPQQPQLQEVTTVKKETTPTGTVTTTERPKVAEPRANQIVANLNEGFKNDPTVQNALNTGDWETFKSAYNMQDPEEAKIVEAYFQARQPKTSDGIFNILLTGQKIYNPSITQSPEYANAKAKYDIYNKYSNATSDQLYSALVNGDINSEMEKTLVTNPNLAIAKEKYNNKLKTDAINKEGLAYFNAISGKQTEAVNPLESLSDKFMKMFETSGKDIQSFKDYLSTNNPDLVKQTTELNAKNTLLKEKTDARDNRLKDIIKNYPGMSKGAAIALASRENEPLNEEIKSLTYELNELQSNINFQTQLAEKDYDYLVQQQQRQQELAKEQRQYAFNLLTTQEQRAYEQQVKQEERTYQEQQQEKKLKQEFDYTYGDLTSTNPQIQKTAALRMAQAIQKQYAGMPFRRTVDVMANDIVNEIKAGKTTDQITKDITNAIQNAPAYKQWATEKGLIKTPQTKLMEFGGDLYKTDDQGNISLAIKGKQEATKWQKLDDGTYVNPQGEVITKAELDQQKILTNSYLNAPKGSVGGECGYFASRAVGLPSLPGGNSGVEKRKQIFSDTQPVPGGMVLFSGGGYDKTYGHIAVVTGVNADGSINVKESNYNQNQKVTERTIPANSPYISGYYNNTPLAGGQETTGLTKDQKADVKNARSNLEQDPQYKSYRTLSNQIKDIEGIQSRITSGKALPQDQQQLITAFAKVLDPTSVVRESEFAITQKYGQAGYEKAIQSAKHYLDGSGVLTPEGTKILAESLSSRYNSISNEYNTVLRSAKDNIEYNLGRSLSDKEFETLTQTKFAKLPATPEQKKKAQVSSLTETLGAIGAFTQSKNSRYK